MNDWDERIVTSARQADQQYHCAEHMQEQSHNGEDGCGVVDVDG